MARKTDEKRASLRAKLIDLAEAHIEAQGLASLRARTLAQEAGCSVGAIYNVFDDLTALVLEVNARTFSRLAAGVATSATQTDGQSPGDRLVVLGLAYLDFAVANPNLWRALFDFETSAPGAVPEWYVRALNELFALIEAPLRELYPDQSGEARDLMSSTLFSAVHGIVLMGLENRIVDVPRERTAAMLTLLLQDFGSRNVI
ncbi:TetR/AcrR family transcriptional regulator [Roseobacteraceae bacterium S113]